MCKVELPFEQADAWVYCCYDEMEERRKYLLLMSMDKQKKKGIWNEYKGLLRKEVQSYCKNNFIEDEEFHFLSIYQWQNVYDKILENFADYKWALHNGLHWLNTNGICKKNMCYAFDSREQWDWILKLSDILDNADEMLYLALEEGSGQKSKFWIAEGKPEIIAKLLCEGLFEDDYYIVDKKYRWMITRNHHGVVLFVGEAEGIVTKLVRYIRR